MSGTPTILGTLARSEPISLGTIDLTFNDAARLRRTLGRTIDYFSRVESEVSAEPLMEMLPRLGTEYRGYKSNGREFLDIWVAQEHAHGAIFAEMQRALGLEPFVPDVQVALHHRVLGALCRMSPALHAVLEMIYLSRGAMHEKLTFIGYERMAERVEALGERALHETVIKPIRKQEAGHFAYYRAEALRLRAHLERWQLAIARRLSIMTYWPVGAGAPRDRAHFGHVALALAGDEIARFSAPVRSIAERLLASPERGVMPNFVARALERCTDAARAEQLALRRA